MWLTHDSDFLSRGAASRCPAVAGRLLRRRENRYRPCSDHPNSVWYVNRSTLGFSAIQFGIATDNPVPAYSTAPEKQNRRIRDGHGNPAESTAARPSQHLDWRVDVPFRPFTSRITSTVRNFTQLKNRPAPCLGGLFVKENTNLFAGCGLVFSSEPTSWEEYRLRGVITGRVLGSTGGPHPSCIGLPSETAG